MHSPALEPRVNHRTDPASTLASDALRCADQLVCTRCGGVTRLDLTEALTGARARAAAHGLAVESHSLTVYGRCWLCRAPEVRA
jgi:Fe2+ or Zn2+ uptake regulation protein